jgi:hypothetical protein
MSRKGEEKRQDPFRHLNEPEPVDDMIVGIVPSALRQPARGNGRKVIRPTERRRRARKLTVTFSDPATVSRLRSLTERWGWESNNGRANVSGVVERLLLPMLEAAEQGEIGPETGAAERREIGLARVTKQEPTGPEEESGTGGQWF